MTEPTVPSQSKTRRPLPETSGSTSTSQLPVRVGWQGAAGFALARYRRFTAVAALLALCVPQSTAQDDLFGDDLDALLGGADTDGGDGDSVLRDWKGFVLIKPRTYFEDRNGEKNDEQLLLEGELELEFRFGDRWSGYFRPRFLVDALDDDLHRFEPYEAYVTYAGDGWDLRAGQFVENWGIVDTYNPIDVINRRDFATDPLDADRLGEAGLRFRRTWEGSERVGEPTLSAYVLPVFRETLFAPDEQRLGFGTAAAPLVESGGFEPSGSDEVLYALRYQSTLNTSFANADVQLLGAHGPSRFPSFFTDGSGALFPAYFGATTVGAGFRAVPNEEVAGRFLSTLTLKAEVVHTDPSAFDGSPIASPEDFTSWVLGVDRSFYGIFGEQDEVTATVEYARETSTSDPASLLRPFRDDLILRALYEANDFARSSVELRALIDMDIDEQIYELIYETQLRSIDEDLKLTVQLQHIDAADPGQSFFGSLASLSSVAFGLRWDF